MSGNNSLHKKAPKSENLNPNDVPEPEGGVHQQNLDFEYINNNMNTDKIREASVAMKDRAAN